MPYSKDIISKEDDDSTTNQVSQQSSTEEKHEKSTTMCFIKKEPQLESRLMQSISSNSTCEKIFPCEKNLESKTLSQMLVKHMLGTSHSITDICVVNDNYMILKILPDFDENWSRQCSLDPNESKERIIHITKLPESESKKKELVQKKSGTCCLCKQHKVKLETLQLQTTESNDSCTKSQKICESINKSTKKAKTVIDSNLKAESDSSVERTDLENSGTYLVSKKNNVSKLKTQKPEKNPVLETQKYNAVIASNACNNRQYKANISNKKQKFRGFSKSTKPLEVSAAVDNKVVVTAENKEESSWEPKKNFDPIDTSKELRTEEVLNTSSVNIRKNKTITERSHIEHFENNPSSFDISKLYAKKNEMQTLKADSNKRIEAETTKLMASVKPLNSMSKREIHVINGSVKMSIESDKIKPVTYKKCKCTNELQNISYTNNQNLLSSEIKVQNRTNSKFSNNFSEVQVLPPIAICPNQKMQDASSFNNKKHLSKVSYLEIPFPSTTSETKTINLKNKTIKARCLEFENKLGVINTSLSKNCRTVLKKDGSSFKNNLTTAQEVEHSTSKICKIDSELIYHCLAKKNKSICAEKQPTLKTDTEEKSLKELKKTNSRNTEYLSSAYIDFRPNVRTDSRSVIKLEKEIIGKTTEIPNSVTMKERCSELEKKLDNMRKAPLKGAKVVDTQVHECSNSLKNKVDANTYNSKKQIPKNTETKESMEASNKTFKSVLLTDNSSLNNISCSSVKHDVNSVLKYQNEQNVMFEAIPEKSKIGPNIRERCLEWEERIRLANSCESRDNKAHDSISESCSNLKLHRIDSDINYNKLIVKTEFPGLTVSNTEKKSKSSRVIGSNTTMLTGTKSKKNMTHERDPNYINVINESDMNLHVNKTDSNTQGFTQNRTNEVKVFNGESKTEICITPAPLTEPFLNSSRNKKYEPLISSEIETPSKHLRITTIRNSKTTLKRLEDAARSMREGVALKNSKNFTKIDLNELYGRYPSRFSIFNCFCNLFHKRNKRCRRSYKKVYAVVNKTYFINWVRQELDECTGCNHCCRNSAIKRYKSTYF